MSLQSKLNTLNNTDLSKLEARINALQKKAQANAVRVEKGAATNASATSSTSQLEVLMDELERLKRSAL